MRVGIGILHALALTSYRTVQASDIVAAGLGQSKRFWMPTLATASVPSVKPSCAHAPAESQW